MRVQKPYKGVSYAFSDQKVFFLLQALSRAVSVRAGLRLLVSAVTLAFPLLVRYITKHVLEEDLSQALGKVYWIGGLMLVLAAVQNLGSYFVDYKGHEVGARMESDMRSELFAHMQKLSFDFYDKEKTGRLMSRLTNDLLLLSELYHHGPEDYVRSLSRFSERLPFCFLLMRR
ncbi:putative multidrug resistance ABC transporter ATP-binding/permease protein YheI [Paenibacillus sp. P1XP2]|nr:putative multidrug resistance ABC transporter ATP-binding/permease protein YheI [Paenibacillus sp. P1XP2]